MNTNGISGIYTYGDTSHTHSIDGWYQVPVSYQPLASQQFTAVDRCKEPEMSAAEKIAKERNEAKAKAKAEALFDTYESILQGVPEGMVVTWADDDRYYASVLNEDQWTITGLSRWFTEAELIAWLIDHKIEPETVAS